LRSIACSYRIEKFLIFKFGEFHIYLKKREDDIIHSLLTEEFFKYGFEAIMKLIGIYATFPTANAEI